MLHLLSKTKKQQLQLHQQASNLVIDDDDDDDGIEITDCHVAYRRQSLVDDDGDEPLSNYVLDRLTDARMLALAAIRIS